MSFSVIDIVLIWYALGMMNAYIGGKLLESDDVWEDPETLIFVSLFAWIGTIMLLIWLFSYFKVRKEALEDVTEPAAPVAIRDNSALMSVLREIGDFGPAAAKAEKEKKRIMSFEF